MASFTAGQYALDRDGHVVRIVSLSREDSVTFAWVTYPNGEDADRDPNGRVAGTVERPVWEHRVRSGKVVRSGGNYWNDADWIVERGLRPLPSGTPVPAR